MATKKKRQPHSEQIHVAMQPHLHRRVEAAAEDKGTTKSAYARQACREKKIGSGIGAKVMAGSALDIDDTAVEVETAQYRRARMILGGLLHSPGSFESAVRAGLSAELIDDRTLRDIFRLIARGPLQTVAVVKGSNITSAGTDAARRLYAETRLLDPACMIGLIADLVGANDNAIGEEPPDDAA